MSWWNTRATVVPMSDTKMTEFRVGDEVIWSECDPYREINATVLKVSPKGKGLRVDAGDHGIVSVNSKAVRLINRATTEEISLEKMAVIRDNIKRNPNGALHNSEVMYLLDALEESWKCQAILQEIFDDVSRATKEAQLIITEAKKNIKIEMHTPHACCRALSVYLKQLGPRTNDDRERVLLRVKVNGGCIRCIDDADTPHDPVFE